MSIRPISDILQEIARVELNEVPERIQDDIQFIRNWIKKQPHLNVDKDDQWILNFLRSCKFSLTRTTEKLDFYFTMRSILHEVFGDRDPLSPKIQEILKRGIFIPVTNVEDGSPIKLLVVWSRTNPKVVSFLDLMKVVFMFFDILMNEYDTFSICGQEIIEDMSGIPLGYIAQITPTLLKACMLTMQNGYPTRVKGMYLFNTVKSYDFALNLCRQVLSPKLKERLKTFGEKGIAAIYEGSPITNFPIEYGGENGKIEEIAAKWKQKFEDNRHWFLKDQEQKSDESKRVGAPRSSADILGIEGSFRKLTID